MHIGRALIVVALLTACAPAGNTQTPAARVPVTLLPTLAPTPVPVAIDPVTPIIPGVGNLPALSRDLIFPRRMRDGAHEHVVLMRYRHESGRIETVLEAVFTPLPNFSLPIADGFVWARWLPDAQAVIYGGLSDPVFVDLKTRQLYAADALLPGCGCFLGIGSLAR